MKPLNLFRNVTREQIKHVYSMAPIGILGEIIIVALATYAFATIANPELLPGWCVLQCAAISFRSCVTIAYRQQAPIRNDDHAKWAFRHMLATIGNGVAWGSSVLLLQSINSPQLHYLILACGLGLAGGSILTMGAIFLVYAGYIIPLLGLLAIWFLLSQDTLYVVTGLSTVYASGYLVHAAYLTEKFFLQLMNKNMDIQETQLEIVRRLGRAGEYRDNDTGQHIIRMSRSCQFLALQAGLGEEFAETLLYSSPMHDVGKIGIPDHILLKPGRLDDKEWRIMQTHPSIGASILDGHDSDVMRTATTIAATHHEKWDGSGYPKGIVGENIPIAGRIAAICDVFDALTSERPYKDAWPYDRAINHIKDNAGTHFDPQLVEHFLAIAQDVIALQQLHPDDGTSGPATPSYFQPAI